MLLIFPSLLHRATRIQMEVWDVINNLPSFGLRSCSYTDKLYLPVTSSTRFSGIYRFFEQFRCHNLVWSKLVWSATTTVTSKPGGKCDFCGVFISLASNEHLSTTIGESCSGKKTECEKVYEVVEVAALAEPEGGYVVGRTVKQAIIQAVFKF